MEWGAGRGKITLQKPFLFEQGRDDPAAAAHEVGDALLSQGIAQMLGKLAYYPLEVVRVLRIAHGARTLRLVSEYASAPAALAALYQLVCMWLLNNNILYLMLILI